MAPPASVPPAPSVESARIDPDRRRRAIVEAAREMFLQDGYAACSMAAVAARVGGSKGTLYNYFPSKEALFAALVGAEVETETAGFSLPEGEGSPGARLLEIGRSFLRVVTSERALALHRLVTAECCRFPELGRAFFENGPARYVEALSAYLARQGSNGHLAIEDPERAAAQFLDLCKAGLHQKLLWNVGPRPDPRALEANVAAAVSVFLSAYGPPR